MFGSADYDTVYTYIYPSADPNPFRGMACMIGKYFWGQLNIFDNWEKNIFFYKWKTMIGIAMGGEGKLFFAAFLSFSKKCNWDVARQDKKIQYFLNVLMNNNHKKLGSQKCYS